MLTVDAIEYIGRGMKSALGKTLMICLSLGLAGNILLNKPDFTYAYDTLDTKPYLELAKQNAGYGNLYRGRMEHRIEIIKPYLLRWVA